MERGVEIRKAQDVCYELLKNVDEICNRFNLSYWIDGGTLLGAERHGGFIPWDDDIDLCLPYSHYLILLEKIENELTDESKFLYFKNTRFKYWCEQYGDMLYLIDGVFPIKIDIIPVKFLPNDIDYLKIDDSLCQIAQIYLLGKAKNEGAILEQHQKYLPDKSSNLLKKKDEFMDVYFQHVLTSEKFIGNDDVKLTYIFNDALVQKKRDFFSYDDIFPIRKIHFEDKEFSCPNKVKNYLTILYGESFMELPPIDKRYTHLQKLYIRKISKGRVKLFLEELYLIGFKNRGLKNRGNNYYRTYLKLVNFVKVIIKKLLTLRWNELRAIVRFARAQMRF